ncbi:FAD:protein FMN transferase [bacterium]|nr:MAG: FAD:protein FMN transferase [bacterium]
MKKDKRKPEINSRFIVYCLAGLILAAGLAYLLQSRKLYRQSRVMMGTFVEVISPNRQAPNIVFNEIRRVERLLSKYIADSEVSRLNQCGRSEVSLETMYILRKSKEFWLITEGKFDITVGPLLDLWGFSQKKYRLPTEKQINAVMPRIGSDKIIFQDESNLVKFKVPDMKIDLGGIAKGFVLDCAVKKLKENGIKSCLINAGGQVFCLGDRLGYPWVIAIQNPRDADQSDLLEIKNQAVATSADYEQFFMIGNRRYSHIFDPKTGYPADSGVISVTVIAKDSLTADALSTAIFILGKEKGLKLLKNFPEAKAMIIEANDVLEGY